MMGELKGPPILMLQEKFQKQQQNYARCAQQTNHNGIKPVNAQGDSEGRAHKIQQKQDNKPNQPIDEKLACPANGGGQQLQNDNKPYQGNENKQNGFQYVAPFMRTQMLLSI